MALTQQTCKLLSLTLLSNCVKVKQKQNKNESDSVLQETDINEEDTKPPVAVDDCDEDMIESTEDITSTGGMLSSNETEISDIPLQSDTPDSLSGGNIQITTQDDQEMQTSVENPQENNVIVEGIVELTTLMPARIDKPIYPKLIDCTEEILPVLKKVTSPKYVTSLLEVLNEKDVKTVGDLAKLTEIEINRLPFKDPRVENVYRTLDAYYKRKEIEKNGEGSSCRNDTDGGIKITPAKKSPSKKINTQPNSPQQATPISSPAAITSSEAARRIVMLSDILSWAEFSSREDAILIVNQLLGRHRDTMLPLVRVFYKSNINEVLVNSDMKMVIEHVIKKIGLSETVKLISKTAEEVEDESVYFDCIVKHCLHKKPVEGLLKNKTVDEIADGLKSLFENDHTTKIEIMEKCLVSFIKSPEDIATCFNHLTVLEIGNVLIERMSSGDANFFIERISEKFGNESVYNMVNKHEFLDMCSTDDVLPVVTRNSEPKEMIDFFTKAVNSIDDKDKQKEVLIGMFKCISSKLSVKTLTELHVEFIQSISNRITE